MLDALLVPRTRDLGDGFEVRRVLPAARWVRLPRAHEDAAPGRR